MAILGIAVATDGNRSGWLILILCAIAFFKVLSLASNADRLALLFRRCARLATATRFLRSKAPPEVIASFRRVDIHEDESIVTTWWDADEKFEEMLRRYAGHSPEWIELVAEDDVLYSAEGKLAGKVHNLFVIRI